MVSSSGRGSNGDGRLEKKKSELGNGSWSGGRSKKSSKSDMDVVAAVRQSENLEGLVKRRVEQATLHAQKTIESIRRQAEMSDCRGPS